MTRYLDRKPFSSRPATDAYRAGWEATFGQEKEAQNPGSEGEREAGSDVAAPDLAELEAEGRAFRISQDTMDKLRAWERILRAADDRASDDIWAPLRHAAHEVCCALSRDMEEKQ